MEDDPDSRELFVDRLRSCKRLQLRGAHGTAEEALREVPRLNPDVVLMDIMLPDKSGIDCLIALRRLIPPCQATVVMLTEHEDSYLIFQALQAGAEGYLLKRHACARELQVAILKVMAGGRPFDRTVAQTVTAFFRTLPAPKRAAGIRPADEVSRTLPPRCRQHVEIRTLTAREEEVLRFAALGLTCKEVAGSLNIPVETVRKHLQSIFHKLHIHCRTDPSL